MDAMCYRAIAINNFHHAFKNQEIQERWLALAKRRAYSEPWWTKSRNKKDIESFASWIILENSKWITDTSMEFSAKWGARYNPKKSYGCLYAADSIEVAVFESLFHIFLSNKSMISTFKKIRKSSAGTFRSVLPEEINPWFCVFEMKIGVDDILDLTKTSELNSVLNKIGLSRYLSKNDLEKNSKLILGNDYDICRMIGVYAKSRKISAVFYPSARCKAGNNWALLKTGLVKPTGKFSLVASSLRIASKNEEHTGELVCKVGNKKCIDFSLENIERVVTKRHNSKVFDTNLGDKEDFRKVITQEFKY